MELEIPNGWAPNRHQQGLWDAMMRDGVNRAVCVWHRRAGKDSSALNITAAKAWQEVGTYWHLLPTAVQARRVIWNETDRHHRRIIDQVHPPELRESKRDDEMSIRLANGSLWQLAGSDNYNSLVGANVRGVVFSEWSLCDPEAWTYIRPILRENGGWAMFIFTPRGRNHGFDLWKQTEGSNRWYRSLLDVRQTYREDGSPVITEADVAEDIADGMSPEMAQQEYYCSFAAGVVGSFFGRAIEEARSLGRIGRVPHDSMRLVHLHFDIGLRDQTACWFSQRDAFGWRFFRYREWRDVALRDIFREVAAMDYDFGTVNLPHDGAKRDQGTAIRLREYADEAFSRADVIVHPQYDVQTSIEASRYLITRSYFDEKECERGIQVLENYRKTWDEKRKVYHEKPEHDWASHGADAFRLAGMDSAPGPAEADEVVDLRGRRQSISVRRSMGYR